MRLMAIVTLFLRLISDLSFPLWIAAASFLPPLIFLLVIRLYTTRRYHLRLLSFTSPCTESTKPQPPPPVPYTIPIVGHASAFLARRPGEFWSKLFRYFPREVGACTLFLSGKSTHILFSPSAVEALLKNRHLDRNNFNFQVWINGLGIGHDEAIKYFGLGEGADKTGLTPVQQQERINLKYLLETGNVNELTEQFVKELGKSLGTQIANEGDVEESRVEGLQRWLQDIMFTASTNTFMGSRLLEVYPNLREDFFEFDRHMLTLFFGVPRLIDPIAYRVRERTVQGLSEWHEKVQQECKDPVDLGGDSAWSSIHGSRANRARQKYYSSRGLQTTTRARFDLGFLFAISSNAIPAAGWMLMHILNLHGDKTVLPQVMEELKTAERADGSLDISILVSLPLVQSIYNEILRLYVDVLVTRGLKDDITLPLNSGKQTILCEKNSIVIAPSYLGHRDETVWVDPPCNQFFAKRFLRVNPVNEKRVSSTSGINGKFFPFGGGKTICPGRVFAKQEVLAAVAAVLLSFDIEPLGFTDERGKSTKKFPTPRKTYPGSAILATDGDMMARIRSRKAAIT